MCTARRQLRSALLVVAACALAACTTSGRSDGPQTGSTITVIDDSSRATAQFDWSGSCSQTWMLHYEGTWRAQAIPASWGDGSAGTVDPIERTGVVERFNEGNLQFRDDDGALVVFVPDVVISNCS